MIFNKLGLISSSTLICLFTFFLTSCKNEEVNVVYQKERSSPKSFDQVLAENTDSAQKEEIIAGMVALRNSDYKTASHIFNELLTNDPTNSALHTLNGLAYQMMGKDGDYTSYDLAEAGYMQAKKYDSNNNFASLQLGRVKAEKKNYVGAQEAFAEVLLFDPNNQDALYELASASYLLGDIKTARMSVDHLLRKDPNNPQYTRAGALIYAVQGDRNKVQELLTAYKNVENSPQKKLFVEKRVNDWMQLHNSGNIILAAADGTSSLPPGVIAQAQAQAQAQPSIQGQTLAPYPQAPVIQGGPTQPPGNPSDPSIPIVAAGVAAAQIAVKSATQQAEKPLPPITPPPLLPNQEPMFVIDGIVLRVIEEASTSKGNNILNNFTLTLSPYTAYSANNAGGPITGASIFPLNNPSTGFPTSTTTSTTGTSLPGSVTSALPDLSKHASLITSGISFGTLNYALNIANATRHHIEIIGRPTLTSYIGKPSEFFNGSELDIALQGNFGGGTITKTPTGSTLRVTPISIEGDYVTMDIEVIDSFLEESEATIVAQAAALTPLVFSLNLGNVKTTVKAKLGETIMLAGTVQRTENSNNSGFPGLKDVPLLQLFFSQETTFSQHQSVMYLITPRARSDVRKAAKDYVAQMDEYGNRPALEELENRHSEWFHPQKNVVPILKSLKPLYYDYRSGDISPLQWGTRPEFDDELTSIAAFLWY